MFKFKYIVNFFLTFFLTFFIHSCVSSDKSDILPDDTAETAIQKAMRNYEQKKYLTAIDDFSLIKLKFSGTKIVDKAQFYLAMCHYQRGEYIIAAYEFENLLKNYSTSQYTKEGRYHRALSFYKLSPDYSLDQTYTQMAIREFQNFIELYPSDSLAKDAQAKIKELRNKLALKDYKAAQLYVTLDNYKAADIYFDHIVEEYYDTDWADDALYSKIKLSISRNKLEQAIKDIEKFEKYFPDSPYLKEIQALKKKNDSKKS
jgi:outer membrane protein assembly factor BamD